MFTRSVRVGCSFQACRGESVKYQTCLIFLRPFPTLVTDPNFIYLATGMSVNLIFKFCFFKQAVHVTDQHAMGQKEKD